METTSTRSTTSGRTMTIISFVLSGIALFFFPPVFGGAALITGVVARSKGDHLATWAIVASVVAIVAGMAIGAAIVASNA
jgi:thiol:disulfide interchange protein